MTKDLSDEQIHQLIIIGYRQVISDRYTYANLIKVKDIPDTFDEEKISAFRDYFLTYLYPAPERRAELDEAFEQLDSYIKNPTKLLSIIMDSASLLWKHGRHLPKILNAGLKTLKSFRAGNDFEVNLIQAARDLELSPPYSKSDINAMIGSLSPTEIETFMQNSEILFENLHDRNLVLKVEEIITALIKKMKNRPQVYSAAEVRGLEIGYEIIYFGNALFDSLSESHQRLLLEFVIENEREELERLFSKGR
jgi:hypothetical protein